MGPWSRSPSPDRFEDTDGQELLTWDIGPGSRAGWGGRFEISMGIHDIDVWRADFGGLEPARAALVPACR